MRDLFKTNGSSPPVPAPRPQPAVAPIIRPDVLVTDHGSIFLVQPLNDTAEDWLESNVQSEAQWFDGGVVVEHRYIRALIIGMSNDGLVVIGQRAPR
jgi:hypothetical protein